MREKNKRKKEMSLDDLFLEIKEADLIHLTLPRDFNTHSDMHPIEKYLTSLGKIYYFEHNPNTPGDYCLDLNEVRITDIDY